MKIDEYLEEKVQAAKAKIAAAKDATNAVENEIEKLKVKSRKLNETRERLIAEDIDKTAVEEKLAAVESKMVELAADLKQKKEALEAAETERGALNRLMKLSELCINEIGLTEIPEIQSAHELLKHFKVYLQFKDHLVTGCSFWWLEKHSSKKPLFELPVVSKEPRGRGTLIPDELEWIPDEWLPLKGYRRDEIDHDEVPIKEADDLKPKQIYYIIPENKFVPLTKEISWIEKHIQLSNYGFSTQMVEVKKNASAGTMAEIIEDTTPLLHRLVEELKDRKIKLFDQNEIAYLNDIAKLVADSTHEFSKNSYLECNEAQTTLDIEKIVEPFLRKFINAPWTPETTGVLANFKYYCEQRERPRFYNLKVEGLYGFRLRTRDHSWIQGQIYIVPEAMNYSGPDLKRPEIISFKRIGRTLARMGRMILFVEENS
jgi:hypothetical protein